MIFVVDMGFGGLSLTRKYFIKYKCGRNTDSSVDKLELL